MAKVKTNFQKLAAAISVPITGGDSLNSIGDFITKRIQGFTRLGYSLAGNPKDPKANKLKPLSLGYIKWRKNLKAGKTSRIDLSGGGLGIGFSPGRSQLTLSGQMLSSITYVVNPSAKTIRVMVGNSQRDDGESNVAIAKKNIDAGRPFMGLDQVGIETIKIRYIKALYRRLKR